MGEGPYPKAQSHEKEGVLRVTKGRDRRCKKCPLHGQSLESGEALQVEARDVGSDYDHKLSWVVATHTPKGDISLPCVGQGSVRAQYHLNRRSHNT
ncbi:hypothetical protein NDU88_003112 [Pleurodeles waltl]|uniref:Uncharacterized protein n=1 Tax=Pleurodeles waltl TaxID=8319 RepID=A0AAV7UD35_PLEWA|nr:hypothetical protein NDU88_003112 [Pleurodeles waltl]